MKSIKAILQISEDVFGPVTQSLIVTFSDGEERTIEQKGIKPFWTELRKADAALAARLEAAFAQEMEPNCERFLYPEAERKTSDVDN